MEFIASTFYPFSVLSFICLDERKKYQIYIFERKHLFYWFLSKTKSYLYWFNISCICSHVCANVFLHSRWIIVIYDDFTCVCGGLEENLWGNVNKLVFLHTRDNRLWIWNTNSITTYVPFQTSFCSATVTTLTYQSHYKTYSNIIYNQN